MSALGTILKGLETDIGAVEHAGRAAAKATHPAPTPRRTNLETESELVNRAAARWRISPTILWGVYGAETAHGANIKTSSAGARGPFQFLPSTARQYRYPLGVNENGVTDFKAFGKQSDAAAHYLSDLLGGHGEYPGGKKLTGDAWHNAWDKALHSYSGGGYGLSHVVEEGKAFSAPFGQHAADVAEHEKIESNPWAPQGEGWKELLKIGLTLILTLAGAALLVYGIMVMLRPPERALQIPKSPFGV